MHPIAIFLKALAVIAALLAAAFWFWASRSRIPPFPDVGLDSGSWVFEPVREALQKASRLNAIAAFCSGVAVLADLIARLVSP